MYENIVCPKCGNCAKIQKVSSVFKEHSYASQTESSTIEIGYNSDNKTNVKSVSSSSSGKMQNILAAQLTPPAKPVLPERYIIRFAIMGMFFGAMAGKSIIENMFQSSRSMNWLVPVTSVVTGIAAFQLRKRFYKQNIDLYRKNIELWQERLSVWSKSYYCHLHDLVFVPVEHIICEVDNDSSDKGIK